MSITVPLYGFGGGGGTSLNFDVKAYATEEAMLAATPKENTIGIITTTPITSWIFSATEPAETMEGMVWITTGTSSTVKFNALKKNCIQVYPISAKQYVSGAWVNKNMKCYQNGKWRDFGYYIIQNGVLEKTLDGDGNLTQGDGIVRFEAIGGTIRMRTIEIDVSNYNTIVILLNSIVSWYGGQTPYIGFSNSKPSINNTDGTVSEYIRAASLYNGGQVKLDVSDISGKVCIWLTVSGGANIGTNNTGFMHIIDLYLE